ncbi:helix-turn-helix domain-containing protein [Bradyrhizobium sp. CB3481]|uniref:winged helix-turn-helix transcriptional regulator n=1 Tax=Bradyrhizobium sp. CB3481 TaxID=3039158 RepID=UPI0024B07054|nr:helix-turn-helix domain-containing protein [Bradyrhizobium sp. CB3481]WFU18219.1 helix-turn-helix domain-containing protein [Bradyrhizobium sp. CB3481]
MTNLHYPQFCALARAAEIVGERWTLLIIRELLLGPKRFGDLLDHLDGMSPTLLTVRLATLIDCNVVRRTALPPPANAQVYELTEIGREVQPAIRELIRWGGRFLFPPVPGDTFESDWVMLGLDAIAKRSPVPEINVGVVVTHGKKSAGFTVAGGGSGTSIRRGITDCRGTLEAPFDAVLQIVATSVSVQDAIEAKRARVSGSVAAVRKLPLLFDLAERRRAAPAANREG